MAQILKDYQGTALQTKQSFKVNKEPHTLEAYLPSNDLIDVVNLAMRLKRPLLLMGEPGCGKTRLAEAVAYELHGDKMYDHYFRWDIKSTTKAKEGVYHYDGLKRLFHAKLGKAEEGFNVGNLEDYITHGVLAQALTKDTHNDLPNVLLIDEIDKADIDFPNDLLLEIDQKTFVIPELGKKGKYQSHQNTLIFITSNQEKELPPAFLRRCIFHYINFPPEEVLVNIVRQHVQSLDDKKVNQALKAFTELRESFSEADKKPSTSELLDWFQMLDYYQQLKTAKPKANERTDSENRLIDELDQLDTGKIPFQQLLAKNLHAQKRINEFEEDE